MKKIFDNLKTEEKEAKIEKIFWLILIISIIIIFHKFIAGKQFYMYLDSGLDIVNQYYPYYINEILSIKDGTFSFWNFDYGFGTSIFNANAWTLDIFAILLVIIGVIFNVSKIHYLLVWMQILKIVAIYMLSKKYLSFFIKDKASCCLASYLTTFSGYLFLWGQHFFLGTACFCVLLLLISIEKFLRETSKKAFINLSLVIAAILIFSYYIGYMLLIVGALYYIYRYFQFNEDLKFKSVFSDFRKCLYSVVIGILISGVIFIPSCYNLLTTSSRLSSVEGSIFSRIVQAFTESFSPEFLKIVFSRLISNNLILSPNDSNYYEQPQFFCTIFIFFFIIQWGIYEFKAAKTKKDYILFGVKLLGLYLVVFSEISGLVFNSFAYPIYRYPFIVVPFLGIIIGTVWEKVIKENKTNTIGLIVSILITLFVVWYSKKELDVQNVFIAKTILWLAIVGFALMFGAKYTNKYSRILINVFLLVIIASNCFDNYITTNNRWIVQKDDYTLQWEKDKLVNDTGKAISWIKENDKSFYRVEKLYINFSQLGDSFLERVSSTLWYNSTMNYGMLDFYKYIYPHADVFASIKLFKLEDESDLQAITLANSKYILSKEPIEMNGIEEINKIGEVYIYRNKYTEQIAKFFTKTMSSEEYQALGEEERVKALYNSIIVDDNKINVDENATAQIGEFYLEKPTYLHGSVSANGEGILMIATPYQEGWKVYVDGEITNQYKVDYGLIGVGLTDGEHEIELKYNVPKIEIGIIVTIIGLINLVFVILKKNGEK